MQRKVGRFKTDKDTRNLFQNEIEAETISQKDLIYVCETPPGL